MSIYRKIEESAKKFDAVYPEELSARLRWWSKALGIDRVRLLRLIGLSARQAAKSKHEDLKDILQSLDWESKAQWVEGTLHRLLALFHYDEHALAEYLHGPGGDSEAREPARGTRQQGEVNHLTHPPNGDASDLLLKRLAEGGSQSLAALLAYLAASQAGA